MIDALVSGLGAVASASDLVYASVTILVAYTIFGLTGFGSSIVAVPFLIRVLPLHVCVVVMLLFDVIVCTLLNARGWSFADKVELKRVLPGLLLGAVLGILLALHAPKRPLFLLLGVFIILVFLWNCFARKGGYKTSPRLAPPLSFAGGVFTTLFGTGGPLYTIYLAGRIEDKSTLRSTLGALIGLTAIVRLTLFSVGGLMSDRAVYLVAAALLPSALLGFILGNLMHRKIASRTAKKVVWIIVLIGGINTLLKGIS